MQLGGNLSGTGSNDLHGQLYNRPTTRLKSKVWLYCIKFCHGARRQGSPMGRPHFPAGVILQPPFTHFWQRPYII
jgi:hypothetical protein